MRSMNLRKLSVGLFCLSALGGISARAEAAPYFTEVPNAFGTQPCGGNGCWTNYLRLTDIDGDKDLDVIIVNATGFFSKGATAQPLVVYTNDGKGVFTDASATAVGGYTGWVRQVAMGDVDMDGDLDMYAPSAWNDPDKFFINDGKGVFTDELATRLPGVASHAGAARFGDVDNDGDLDLLVGDSWADVKAAVAHLYINDGSGVFTEAMNKVPTVTAGTDGDDFDLIDVDGDFDLDLLYNMHRGTNNLWLNDGTGTFTDAPFPAQPANPYHYDPVACDVDGDNDLDIWIDNTGPTYMEQLLINDGTGKFTDETAARVTGNVTGADDNGVACIDIDGDGDLDAAVMSLSDEERVLANDGTGKFSLIPDTFTAAGDPTLWFEFGDLNGDGKLDVVTGQGEGNPQIERVYFGSAMAPVDTVAPKFRAVESVAAEVDAGATPVVRFAVSDNATTDEGPRLQRAYVKVTTTADETEVEATFMGGDLFRAKLPAQSDAGMVTYAVCAIDMQGNNACAPGKTYTVKGGAASSSTGVGGGSASSSASGGDGGAGQGGAGQGGSGGGEDDDGRDEGDESGCGCAVPGQGGGSLQAALGAGLFAALALRLSRSQRRRRARKN
jgi:hypothetical protein